MEGRDDKYKVQRSTSIRLRKKRDQAKKEFLRDRRSGDFGYNSNQGGWSYLSFPSTQSVIKPDMPGPLSLGVTPVNAPQHQISGGARSLCFIPSVDDHVQQRSYQPTHQPGRQVMSDTEDCVGARRRGGRGGEEARQRKLWRKSALGIGEAEHSRNIIYKDFGPIDCAEPDHMRHGQRNQSLVNTEKLGGCGQAFKVQPSEPFSLPVTIRDFNHQNEHFPLLKGMLWQKKERIFSRWKERFFILTPKYIQCYEKSPVHSNDSSLFQVALSSIEKMDLTEKKGYLTIALSVHKEGKILLRSSLGIREWFLVIKRCCKSTLEHANTEEFWSGRLQRESDNIDSWLLSRQGLGTRPVHHASTPTIRPGSLYNQPVPTIYQTTNQDIWPAHNNKQARAVSRSNSKKNSRRPKSCVEAANPWYLQKQEKNCNRRIKTDPISEDSGNSSLSASIGSIRERARKSKNFLTNH